MMDPLIAFVILGAVAAFSIGCAKLVAWCIDRREEVTRRAMREALMFAQARAALADRPYGWVRRG